jgi:hypothetical protein
MARSWRRTVSRREKYDELTSSHGNTIFGDGVEASERTVNTIIALADPGVRPKPKTAKQQIGLTVVGDQVVKHAGEEKLGGTSPGKAEGAIFMELPDHGDTPGVPGVPARHVDLSDAHGLRQHTELQTVDALLALALPAVREGLRKGTVRVMPEQAPPR